MPPSLDVHGVFAVAVAPARPVGDGLPGRALGSDKTHLQAVALEAVTAGERAGVVHRRVVDPAGEQVEPLRVVHGVDPGAELVALLLGIAADEQATREVPVIDPAVDRHAAGGGQHPDAQVLGLGGVGGRRGKQGEQNGGEGGCWKASHADLREHCRQRSGGPTIRVPVGGGLTFVVAVGAPQRWAQRSLVSLRLVA